MAEAISTAAAIIGLARNLGDLLGKIKDKSVRDELQDNIFRMREEALRLQEENAALRDENRKLGETASDRVNPAEYKRERNAYWKDGSAYCMRCMEKERKARTLFQESECAAEARCPTCNAQFPGVFDAEPIPSSPPEPEWWNPSGR